MSKNFFGEKNNLANKLKKAQEELSTILNEDESPQKAEEISQPGKTKTQTSDNTLLLSCETEEVNEPDKKKDSKKRLSKKEDKISPKLFISGRFNRKEHEYTNKSFYILDKLDQEIKSICRGTDITIYNYLIFLGLEEVKKSKNMVTAEVKDIEEKYT